MTTNLCAVIGQINAHVGDIYGNTERMVQAATLAFEEHHADLIIFPELALCGYPPEDLLLRHDFFQQIRHALEIITTRVPFIDLIFGYPAETPQGVYNAAAYIHQGKMTHTYYKQCLPNYGVFDEKRYFTPGGGPTVISIKGLPVGITICEDLWFDAPYDAAVDAGAKLVVSLNASPFNLNKSHERESLMRGHIARRGVPIVYVQTVGGQDELIFDGGSLAMDGAGDVCQQAPFFTEGLYPLHIQIAPTVALGKTVLPPALTQEEQAYKALVLGLRDYIHKNKFTGALIGLSGGIDSALVLTVAVDALGADNVEAVLMPSRYTAAMSNEDAITLANKLNVKHSLLPIEPTFTAFLDTLAPLFAHLPPNEAEENLQARCRGTLLMALSNKTGKLVLTTGNKSEMAVGYATLYGDMAGGFAVLKDVPKTWVYRLAEYRNRVDAVIPERIITRPPSAELAPDQKDEDSLPPYAILDQIIERYVEKNQSMGMIIAAGFDKQMVEQTLLRIQRNEYKRRQSPPGVRITARAFGKDWRFPITSGFDVEG